MATLTEKPRLFTTRHDLPEAVRVKVIEVLNQSLASTLDLYTQVKQAHWNVKGKDFYQLHLLFDDIAGDVFPFVDELAERITALGGTAMGTARLATQYSILPEYPHDIAKGREHIQALLDRVSAYCKHVRENIEKTDNWGDADTADLYTQISRVVDKRQWFLEAHLEEG